MTAASNKLPLGSKVKVENERTGKTAVVKINDRMSHNVSAVVDLSKSAASKLGVKGTCPVDAKVVKVRS
jgi:rare lipoprotein A